MQHFQIKPSITDKSTESVKLHLKEISKYKILTPEEEIDLATKSAEGDIEARDTLIKSNMRFVVSIAKQYQGKGVDLEDLIAVGNCGLLKATEKFNPELGYRFLSYAGWWIRDFIINEIINHGRLIRIPFNKTMSMNKLNKIIVDFETKYERTPTAEELSELMEIDEKEIESLVDTYSTSISRDLEDCNIGYTQELECGLSALLPFLKTNLTAIEYDVIVKSFGLEGEEMELKEIAKMYNLTRERVRQVRNKAIIKLRKHPNINNLFKLI
jgi:RNA polymerase primary sigma factor